MKSKVRSFAFLALLWTTMSASPTAWAGGSDRGGGDAIICFRGLPIFGSRDIYLADTFVLRQQGLLDHLPRAHHRQILDATLEAIRADDAEVGEALSQALKEIKFVFVKKLRELDDDNIQVNAPRCKKKQLAIQDIATGIVKVNYFLYRNLSLVEQALLALHEAFIRVRLAPGDTTPIRERVRQTVAAETFAGLLAKVISRDKSEEMSRAERTELLTKILTRVAEGKKAKFDTDFMAQTMAKKVHFPFLIDTGRQRSQATMSTGYDIEYLFSYYSIYVPVDDIYRLTRIALTDESVTWGQLRDQLDALAVFPLKSKE